jgi:hypothetical protein
MGYCSPPPGLAANDRLIGQGGSLHQPDSVIERLQRARLRAADGLCGIDPAAGRMTGSSRKRSHSIGTCPSSLLRPRFGRSFHKFANAHKGSFLGAKRQNLHWRTLIGLTPCAIPCLTGAIIGALFPLDSRDDSNLESVTYRTVVCDVGIMKRFQVTGETLLSAV